MLLLQSSTPHCLACWGTPAMSCLDPVSPKASVLSPCARFQAYGHNQIQWFLSPCVFSGYKCWDYSLGCTPPPPSCLACCRSWWKGWTVMTLLEFGSAPPSLPVSLVVVAQQGMQHSGHTHWCKFTTGKWRLAWCRQPFWPGWGQTYDQLPSSW